MLSAERVCVRCATCQTRPLPLQATYGLASSCPKGQLSNTLFKWSKPRAWWDSFSHECISDTLCSPQSISGLFFTGKSRVGISALHFSTSIISYFCKWTKSNCPHCKMVWFIHVFETQLFNTCLRIWTCPVSFHFQAWSDYPASTATMITPAESEPEVHTTLLLHFHPENASMTFTGNHTTLANDSLPNTGSSLQDMFHFQYYAWAVVGNIISGFGLLGNILSIIVLSNKRMSSTTSLYLMALAVFDSLVLVSLILFMALPSIYYFTGKLESYNRFYPYLHPFAYPTALTAQTCSIYITVGFTVERYIAVCHPLKATKMCTMSRARKSLLLIFACSLTYNIPRMLEYQTVHKTDPLTNETYVMYTKTNLGHNKTFCHIYFIYMNMIVMLIVPFTVLAVLNTLLIRAVKHSERAQGKVSHRTCRDNNLTVMLISVVIVFLICQVPSIVDNILMATLPEKTLNSPPLVKLTCICSLMVITNSAVNFYLYCMFGHKFRMIFCSFFCRCYLRVAKGVDHDALLAHSNNLSSVRRPSSKTLQPRSSFSLQMSSKRDTLHKNDKTLLMPGKISHVKYRQANTKPARGETCVWTENCASQVTHKQDCTTTSQSSHCTHVLYTRMYTVNHLFFTVVKFPRVTCNCLVLKCPMTFLHDEVMVKLTKISCLWKTGDLQYLLILLYYIMYDAVSCYMYSKILLSSMESVSMVIFRCHNIL